MRLSYLVPERIRDALNRRTSRFNLQGRIESAFGWARQSIPVVRRLLKKGDELGDYANLIPTRAKAGEGRMYKRVGRPPPD